MSNVISDISRKRVQDWGIYAVLYGVAFLFLVPYLWMFSTSIKPQGQVFTQVPHWIPADVTARWYLLLLQETPIVQWVINTFVISTVTTVMVLTIDSMIAFAITKLDWPGKRYVLGIIIASFMVPVYVNIIPLYTLISELGLLNNYLAVILPFAAGPLGVFMLVQFFRDVPDELIEAARLDGFSSLRIYTHIVLPLMKPALVSLALFMFVWSWNQFLWPLLVLQNSMAYTLPIGLVTMQPTNVYQPGVEMAAAAIASVPLFVVFLLLQDQLINAIQMQGATK
ncbi:carbohydrate ABC transporter permease [halophilic archaeon]|nr:carbohydrate ABC transporter permease [halophilic archaeon]